MGTINAKSFSIQTNGIPRLYLDSSSAKLGVFTSNPQSSFHIASTDALILPKGNTAERPVVPVLGMIRFNNQTGLLEGYTSAGWKSFQ